MLQSILQEITGRLGLAQPSSKILRSLIKFVVADRVNVVAYFVEHVHFHFTFVQVEQRSALENIPGVDYKGMFGVLARRRNLIMCPMRGIPPTERPFSSKDSSCAWMSLVCKIVNRNGASGVLVAKIAVASKRRQLAMRIVRPRSLVFALVLISIISCLELVASKYPAIGLYAQAQEKVRPLKTDFISETGCPITVSNIRTELDMDPFDVPIDARIYIDYQNNGQKTVVAAKFRMRFTDDSGKDLGTLNGSDGATVGAGQTGCQKWRREKIDPRTTMMKVRVLLVKFSEGDVWQSAKLVLPALPPPGSNPADYQQPGQQQQPPGSDQQPQQ